MTLAVNKSQEQNMEPVNVGGRFMGAFKQRVDETITYLIDYSNWLADGETISSSSFYISPTTTPAGVIVGSTVQNGNQILFQFDNGKDGQKYVITVEATTSTGQIKVDYFTLSIGTPSKDAALSTVETAVTASQTARIGAETAQTGAIAARVGAEAARTGAQTAQAGAEAALAGIGTSLTQAQTAKTGAETARDAAITAKTAAETARTGAEAAQAGVTTARDAALAAQAAAETARTGAETARTGAQTAKSGAEAAQAAASTSATDAATSASTVGANASIASNKASEAATSATNAASSATTATTKASEAATSATNSATSASAASTSASNAATSASNAATSATNASGSASAAASARTAAESARDATLAAYDNFDDRYLGAKANDPTTDNDGNALIAGSLYFNSTIGGMKVYTGTDWVAAYISGASGSLLSANNLSDLTSSSQARNNLSLGDSATKNVGTTAGTVAAGNDSRITGAAQVANNLSDLASAPTARTNLGLGTAATQNTTAFAAASHNHIISDVTGLQTALDAKQPLDADLTAIASLAGTDGLLKKTAADTWVLDTTAYHSGTLTVAQGGTGLASLTAGYIPFGNGTSALGSSITLFWDNANSRLGLGTTTPAYTLDVNSYRSRVAKNTSGFAETLIANTGGNLSLGLESSAGSTLLTGASAYSGVINVTGAYALSFATSNTLRMTISATGNVGIGTSSPSSKLDVAGTGHFTGALTLDAALTVANGGTGATDAATARTNLGLGSAATQSTQDIANTVLAAIPDPVAMALVFGS